MFSPNSILTGNGLPFLRPVPNSPIRRRFYFLELNLVVAGAEGENPDRKSVGILQRSTVFVLTGQILVQFPLRWWTLFGFVWSVDTRSAIGAVRTRSSNGESVHCASCVSC